MTSITFTGDIGFEKYMYGKWDEEGFLEDKVRDFLLDSDHLCVDVEGPLYKQHTGGRPDKDGACTGAASLVHGMDPAAVRFLDDIHADIWHICNNHIMDAGPEGIANTLKLAKEHGALTLGAGMNIAEASSPVIFHEAGGIGLIGVGYQRACRKAGEDTPGCFSWSDLELVKQRIEEIKKECRWCIVVAHAGEEFTSLPTPYTRERYLEYLDMGADIVIGHHPHVPMSYESVGDRKEKVIFYSLGNFVFDTDYQRTQYNTESGEIIKLNFTGESYTFEALGLLTDRENGKVLSHELPDIFCDVPEEEYRKLVPLSAKAFLSATKRQLRYLDPEKYENATEEDFMENFMQIPRSGRVPCETLDFHIIVPLAESMSEKAVDSSHLPKVVRYIKRQL